MTFFFFFFAINIQASLLVLAWWTPRIGGGQRSPLILIIITKREEEENLPGRHLGHFWAQYGVRVLGGGERVHRWSRKTCKKRRKIIIKTNRYSLIILRTQKRKRSECLVSIQIFMSHRLIDAGTKETPRGLLRLGSLFSLCETCVWYGESPLFNKEKKRDTKFDAMLSTHTTRGWNVKRDVRIFFFCLQFRRVE